MSRTDRTMQMDRGPLLDRLAVFPRLGLANLPTPLEPMKRLTAHLDKNVLARLADLGQSTPPSDQQTPESLGAYQRAEIEKWWPIIKAANIKAE